MARTIRLAIPADANQCVAVYAPHVLSSAVSFEIDVPSTNEFAARITQTLEQLPWLVCAEDDAVLGYAYASPHQQRAAYQWSVDVSVYVRAGRRQQRVGQALYTSLFACLRALGYHNAFAAITLPNPASVALHEALSFRHMGTFDDVGYKLGRWHAVGWWGLALRPPNPPTELIPLPDAVGTDAWRDALASGEALLS